ncbi:MAG: transcription antitermination factor NusB [Desulfuromonadales bacterium]|nr:transcription antitermination factor NusB [Desulfuromonadales bacterium]
MARGIRRQGREMALKILYSLADHEGGSLEKVLADFWGQFRFRDDILGDVADEPVGEMIPQVRAFAEQLVSGVAEHLEQIDRVIGEQSTNWALDRMARVDLALLRLGVFELLNCPDVPHNVVINEAIELGKRFGTVETPPFINGVLDQVARKHRNVPETKKNRNDSA